MGCTAPVKINKFNFRDRGDISSQIKRLDTFMDGIKSFLMLIRWL